MEIYMSMESYETGIKLYNFSFNKDLVWLHFHQLFLGDKVDNKGLATMMWRESNELVQE